jgi:site-specific recombinase
MNLAPFAKFVVPAVLAVLAAIVQGAATGHFDRLQLEIAVVGLCSASLSFAVTNGPVGIRRFAKAIAPALLTVAGVLVHWAVTGQWSDTETAAAITGLAAALITFFVPNVPLALTLPPVRAPLAPAGADISQVPTLPGEHAAAIGQRAGHPPMRP